MFLKKIAFIFILISFLSAKIWCDEEFYIDWQKGRIYSSVIAYVKNDFNFASNRLKEIRKAKDKVKANFYKALKTINIHDSVSFLNYFEESKEKNNELFYLIENAAINEIEYPNINSIKLSYFIQIYGERSLMDIMMKERKDLPYDLTSYMGFYYNIKYTGIVIDARGEMESYNGLIVNVEPSLFTSVKDSEGRLVFDHNNIYPEIIKKRGMAMYSYDINENYKKRVGNNPLRIVASGVGNGSGSIIVITESDAMRMLSSEMTREAIKKGKIVIVIDSFRK